jgi:hypothetical protein
MQPHVVVVGTRTCHGASVQEPAAAGQALLRPPHWDHAWMALEHVGAGGGGGGVGLGTHIHLRGTEQPQVFMVSWFG